MNNAISWRTEAPPLTEGRNQLQRVVVDNRIETLRAVAEKILAELDSLTTPMGREAGGGLQDEVQRFEMGLIRSALERAGGSQVRAARLLGVKPTTLNAKLKRYRLLGGSTDVESREQEVAA